MPRTYKHAPRVIDSSPDDDDDERPTTTSRRKTAQKIESESSDEDEPEPVTTRSKKPVIQLTQADDCGDDADGEESIVKSPPPIPVPRRKLRRSTVQKAVANPVAPPRRKWTDKSSSRGM